MATEFADGVWYVDLAPITHPDVVPVAVARALGLPDQPGRSTMDTLLRFVGDRRMLLVLDNCEHLLDASAALVVALLGALPGVTLLATSREPLGVAGRGDLAGAVAVTGRRGDRVVHRPRPPRPARLRCHRRQCRRRSPRSAGASTACRWRSNSRRRECGRCRSTRSSTACTTGSGLLTGGARTAVRRQQTLRASVDWSHALLTEPERVLFRRLAVFLGGFDLDAAQAVAGADRRGALPGSRPAHACSSTSRWSSPKTPAAERDTGCWRRCASTRWRSSASPARPTMFAPATATTTRPMAAVLDAPDDRGHAAASRAGRNRDRQPPRAFAWSRENGDTERGAGACRRPCSRCGWRGGRMREGLAWLDAALADSAHGTSVRRCCPRERLADKALLARVDSAGTTAWTRPNRP